MWGTEVARGDGPVPFLVYQQRRRRFTELLEDAARWADRDHLVQGRRRVTFAAMAAAADRVVLAHRSVIASLRGEQPVTRHANTLANTTDISGEVTRRFLPGLKAGVSTPRFS